MNFFFGKENIFRCLVALKKMLWKTHFLLVIHIFSTFKQIYNIVSQYINTKETKPNKNIHQIWSNWERERERDQSWASGRFDWEATETRSSGKGYWVTMGRSTYSGLLNMGREKDGKSVTWVATSLSLWKWFECRIDVQFILHFRPSYFTVNKKWFSVWLSFLANPNTPGGVKYFLYSFYTRNKHILRVCLVGEVEEWEDKK